MESTKKVADLLYKHFNLDKNMKILFNKVRRYTYWTKYKKKKFGTVQYQIKFASQNRVLENFHRLMKFYVSKLKKGTIKPKSLSKENSSRNDQNSSKYKKRRVLNRHDLNQNNNQINANTRQYQENYGWGGNNGSGMGNIPKQRGGGRGRGRSIFNNSNTNFNLRGNNNNNNNNNNITFQKEDSLFYESKTPKNSLLITNQLKNQLSSFKN
ncbi:hypothetical protein M0812_02792 [Anaeramoeba flamelloides]|uniref:Uncharacterized protein n=1 Tax=Anaeramoeba flamelloides TaxID=1746091 RepID=A0AAV7YN69_9EUKA|nr:hypothetical protein M0812_02792 [Anaeramoeba flamelloides]